MYPKTVKDFVDAVQKRKINFPLKKDFYSEEEIIMMFNKLKQNDYNDYIIEQDYFLRNISIPKNMLKFKNKQLLIKAKKTDYGDFNVLSDMFQELARMKCLRYDASVSPYDYFYSHPKELAEYALKVYGEINAYNIREAIWKLTRECTSFRPNVMVHFIQMFNATCVLDFSAGWGDRLLGCLAMDIEYTGIDPNPAVHNGYKQMIELFSTKPEKYILIQDIAENATIPIRNYDLIFTSPPYFDLEIYVLKENDPAAYELQSSSRNLTEKSWLENFLLIAMRKCWNLLVPNGIMAININQKNRDDKYVMAMINRVNRDFPHANFLGTIAYSNSDRDTNSQPIFVWRKGRGHGA